MAKKLNGIVAELIFTFADSTQAMGKFDFEASTFKSERAFKREVKNALKEQKETRKLVKVSCCVDLSLSTDKNAIALLLTENSGHWYINCNGKLFF